MIGLLWQRDRADEPIEMTIRAAAARHAERFGEWPTVVLVAPGIVLESITLDVGKGKQRQIEVRPSSRITPGHVMVAVEGREMPKRGVRFDPIVPETGHEGALEGAADEREVSAVEGDEALETPPLPAVPRERRRRVAEQPLELAPTAEAARLDEPSDELLPPEALTLQVEPAIPAAEPPVHPLLLPDTEPAAEPVAPEPRRPVKRRSTMLWDPAQKQPPPEEDDEAQQLSLF